jgi:S-adenosylmethionine uptake transporter
VFLCLLDTVVKGLSADFSTIQIVCLRFMMTCVWLGLWLAVRRAGWPSFNRLGVHAVRALTVIAASGSFFYALGRMPFAELFAICLTSPLFMALFGAIFLRERVRLSIAGAIAIGFAGVIVIVGDGFGSAQTTDPTALVAALLSPIVYASNIVILRAQTAHESPDMIVLMQSLCAGLFTLPVAALDFHPLTLDTALLFVLIGLLGASGHLLFAYALSRTSAARFSIVEYTGLLWAAVFGYIFFAEVPKLTVWIGAALIIAACLLVLREKTATAKA